MPYDPTYHWLWGPDKIRTLVEDCHPDVVEAHSPYVAAGGLVLSPPGGFRIRTFFWHSDFIDTYKRVLGAMQPAAKPVLEAASWPLWAWVRVIARSCAATFCASRYQANKLTAHGVDPTCVPLGVDKEVFRPRERPPPRAPAFVALGRHAVEKRWDVVIDAFRVVSATHPEASLTVYGDGPERRGLEARAAGANVRFVGFVQDREELAHAVATADALLHGCPHETFGISVAEAIACGTPVVVPDEGGAAELVRPDHSEVYRAGDVAGCAAAIERLLARDATTLRTAALDASRRVLSVRGHFEQILEHYRALLPC